MSSTKILEADQIERKLQRIARQILEDFHEVSDLYFITIAGNGEPVGIRLAQIIQEIGSTRVHASTVTLNKQAPLSQDIQLSSPLNDLKDQQVVIVSTFCLQRTGTLQLPPRPAVVQPKAAVHFTVLPEFCVTALLQRDS